MIKLTEPRKEVLLVLSRLTVYSPWAQEESIVNLRRLDNQRTNTTSTIRVLDNLRKYVPRLVEFRTDPKSCKIVWRLTLAGRAVVDTQLSKEE